MNKTQKPEQGHTPGPWQTSEYTTGSDETRVGVDQSDPENKGGTRSIASMTGSFYTRPGQPQQDRILIENRANARLIAAAPELLEACRQILWKLGHNEKSEHYSGPGRVTRHDATVRMAQAAVDKAEGN